MKAKLDYAQEKIDFTIIQPIRWNANFLTIWGGDHENELFSAEIQLRGASAL